MSQPVWQERFPEFANSKETLEQLLTLGQIPEDRYINWASETFKIPSLDNVFLNQIKNFSLVLSNPSPEWSASFFPIHEWQGMLYIACLQPRTIQLNKKHCFVLASFKSMTAIWAKMEKPNAPVVAESAAAPTTPPATPSWLPVPENEDDPFSASVVIPLANLEAMMEKTAAEISKVRNNTSAKNPNVREDTKSTFTVNPNLSSPNFKVPEITNVFKMGVPKDMTFTTTKTIMPFPESTKDFTFIRTVYSEQVIIEAHGKVQDNMDPQAALCSAFKVLKDYYKKLMWVVRDQKGRAFPIACNDDWNFSDEAWSLPINFKSANPFRLAKFTQKPYHGPVFPNEVNDLYFQHWNNGKYPNILTIIPVKMGGKVFGYFVGCEKGPHYHPEQTLDIIESVCSELVDTFVRIHQELSKPKKSA